MPRRAFSPKVNFAFVTLSDQLTTQFLQAGCHSGHPTNCVKALKILVWLSVWSEVQMICIWSSWCHCYPIISCFIKIQNGSAFLVPAYPGCPGKRPLNGSSSSSCSSSSSSSSSHSFRPRGSQAKSETSDPCTNSVNKCCNSLWYTCHVQ